MKAPRDWVVTIERKAKPAAEMARILLWVFLAKAKRQKKVRDTTAKP